MTLKPGQLGAGGAAWSLVDDDDEVVKQFCVTLVGRTSITLDIVVILGPPLTGDELEEVHNEVARRNPGREVVWKHTIRFVPDAPLSGIRVVK